MIKPITKRAVWFNCFHRRWDERRDRWRSLLVLGLAGSLAGAGCPDRSSGGSDLKSVASACMRATACRVQPYAQINGCVYAYTDLRVHYGEAAVMSGIYRCVNQASKCSEVEACFGKGEPCNSSFQAYCDGDTAVYCDLFDGATYRYACGEYGLTCRPDPYVQYAATCVPAEQMTASAEPIRIELACDGTLCTRTGSSCDPNDLDFCSYADVVACVEGEVVLFHCSALGLRDCVMEHNGWGHCQSQIEVIP